MAKVITKEEFCKNIKTKENSWLFDNPGECAFFLETDDGMWIYCNGIDKMYEFKDMPEYGEIWMSCTNWSLFNTWKVYPR